MFNFSHTIVMSGHVYNTAVNDQTGRVILEMIGGEILQYNPGL